MKRFYTFIHQIALSKIVIFLIFIFWPLSLFLANLPKEFIVYIIPPLLVFISYYLFSKENRFYFLPLIFITFVSPKLAIFPLLISIIFWLINRNRLNFIFIILSFLSLLFFFKSFWGQTIFKPDYEATQSMMRNIYLYPKPILARIFQNKARIYLDKVNNNFFALTDPSNYFFGFHPREIVVNNQNLDKFPFLALPLFIYGIFKLKKDRKIQFIAITVFSAVISLTILTNFDRNDFILWSPLFLILVKAINEFENNFKRISKWFFLIFIVISLFELARILAIHGI